MDTGVNFTTPDWIVLILYFTLTMGVGFFFYRKTRSIEGFTAANRTVPGWVAGLSIFATFLSSISYLANPGKSFASNWSPFVFSLSVPLAAWVAVRYFLPYYRNSGHVSAYTMLEQRFGLWARIYASAVFYLPTQLARIAVVMYLTALPLQMLFGWDIYTVLIVLGVCVTLYSFVGGLTGVIWNDAIQAIVLMGGALLAVGVMISSIPGGIGELFTVAHEHRKFSLGELGAGVRESGRVWLDLGSGTILVLLAYGFIINIQNFGVDQSYIQRYIASNSDREAKRGLWLAGLLYVPMSALFFFIGTALFVQYGADQSTPARADPAAIVQSQNAEAERVAAGAPVAGDVRGEDLQQVQMLVARGELVREGVDPDSPTFGSLQAQRADQLDLTDVGDRAFPHFIATHMPAGTSGLLIAAVFAAAMSTISTSMNSSATVILSDYYQRLFNREATERRSMLVLYSATIVWGGLGTGLAVVLVEITESALDIWWTLSGLFGAGITGLFLLGLISRRASNPAAVTGVLLGLTTILWMAAPKLAEYLTRFSATESLGRSLEGVLSGWASPFNALLIPVIGALLILLVGLLVSRRFGRTTVSACGPSEQ